MNTKSFFFLIMGNLGQWKTKVDKTTCTKTGYDKAVEWGLVRRVKKSDLRLGFPLSNLHQHDKLHVVCNLPILMSKNFPWHSRPIFFFKPGQITNTLNVKERPFTDMSL